MFAAVRNSSDVALDSEILNRLITYFHPCAGDANSLGALARDQLVFVSQMNPFSL